MAARRMRVILFFLCFCSCMSSCYAQASSTVDAKEPISVQNECVLTISYRSDGVNITGLPIKLYHIADVSEDFQYTLSDAFAGSGLIFNGIQTIGEWNVIRSTLEAYILANNIEQERMAETDQSGLAYFEALKPGLYFVEAQTVVRDDFTYSFDSALIALPGLGEDGLWQYQVEVRAKSEMIPPVEPNDEIHLKVLKLWKGDNGRTNRPTTIEVEIFRNGISEKTVILSEENHWTYNWTAKDDGAIWTVVERNIPSGYTMTVEKRETAFVLTNRHKENSPSDSPQTGDTSHILLYNVLMYASGIILILVGITGKRKHHEKEE